MRRAAGVVLVAESTGRVLFLRRLDGTWGIPGGMAERRDGSARATALRELTEETGYRGPLELEPRLLLARRWPRGLHYVTLGAVAPQEFSCTLSDGEHTAYRWAYRSRAPGPLHQGVSEALAVLDAEVEQLLSGLE